jgi:hypothetical protein
MGPDAQRLAANPIQSAECRAPAGETATGVAPVAGIAPGICRSQEAFRRSLPELLLDKKLYRRWVAYAGDEFIGLSHSQAELYDECLRRGIKEEDFIVGCIVPEMPRDTDCTPFKSSD